jgi:hypothetical protein
MVGEAEGVDGGTRTTASVEDEISASLGSFGRALSTLKGEIEPDTERIGSPGKESSLTLA